MHAAIPSVTSPPLCLSCDILFLLNTICSVIFFFSQRPLCCWRVSAMLDTWLPALSKSLLCWSLQSIHQSVCHIHCGLVRNESLNIRIRRTKKGKEIFRVKVGVRYGKVCLTWREWQIKPTGSLSLHLRADNAGLPISVHELHQFSGSIVEINV